MSLLQISEPGLSPEPHQRRRAVGIDLGTTNSLVATVRSASAETLPDEQGRHLLPSAVRYTSDGVVVGDSARAAAASDPLNTLLSVKRFMGRGRENVVSLGSELPYQLAEGEGMVRFDTAAGTVSPVEASAEILKKLASRAEATLDGPLDGAVITVPAYFDDAQRQATKDAATLAGLKVLRLLNEPTAAAVAYGLDQQGEGVIAVYDLGGGTFDISILRLSRGVFEVLATGGDSALGGDDFDRALAQWLRQQAGLDESLTPSQQRQLLDAAQSAKEALSSAESANVDVVGWKGQVTRQQLNELIDPLIQKTLRACRKSLRDASLDVADVDNVVMVGGSTRALRVREKVSELFAKPPLTDIDPDRVVAIGAALQADVLVGNKPDDEMLLLDVIPLSLGLETMGGLTEKVIHRNTTIPVAKAQEFTTYKDGQTAMAIHVLQGERELVADNRSLARFELRNMPPMAAGAAKIRVTFQVDADGLLSVFAKELTSDVEAHIEVKPSYGLTDSEVTSMLQDSFEHARDDMQARALREQQVEAQRMVEDLNAALELDGRALLSADEFHCLEVAVEELADYAQGSDHRAIARHIEAVAKASEEFAARRMDNSIRKALAGHHLEDFEQSDK
ncbi:Fe-S protein assembly chaperone HscA [Porticoccus sp. W117]|uniref:Fe-S protein assembly chaperone HscA n=1 Tax=Porticoccus sp. W117 TaxID=3054777 RepID=UPI0025956FF0|nr:Fe-S protein assembly chaperone HscA [Porticoccus sp. W117]MDM3870118.1 Fe-S protein assembly chaperone HscA [Porticoccus sp. W117]